MNVLPGRVMLTLSAFTVVTGCHTADDRRWTERDSAGVRIVEHTTAILNEPAGWRVAPVPVVDIRENDSVTESVTGGITRVFRWEDGRIGIVSLNAPFLRIHSPDGTPIARIVTEGQGPGEARSVSWGATRGDSAVVLAGRRLLLYGPTGEFVRSIPLQEGLPGRLELLASTDNGWIASWEFRDPGRDDHGPPETGVIRTWIAGRLNADGTLSDTLAVYPRFMETMMTAGMWGMNRRAASDGARLFSLEPQQFAIRTYERGKLTSIVRAPVPRIADYSEAHVDLVSRDWGAPGPMLIKRQRDLGLMLVPPALAILARQDGSFLVRRVDAGRDALVRVWDVFRRAGSLGGDAGDATVIHDS